MLLKKLYEVQTRMPQKSPEPPTQQMSQLQMKATATSLPSGLQSTRGHSDSSPNTRSSPVAPIPITAAKHSPPAPAPFSLVSDGEIRQGTSGQR